MDKTKSDEAADKGFDTDGQSQNDKGSARAKDNSEGDFRDIDLNIESEGHQAQVQTIRETQEVKLPKIKQNHDFQKQISDVPSLELSQLHSKLAQSNVLNQTPKDTHARDVDQVQEQDDKPKLSVFRSDQEKDEDKTSDPKLIKDNHGNEKSKKVLQAISPEDENTKAIKTILKCISKDESDLQQALETTFDYFLQPWVTDNFVKEILAGSIKNEANIEEFLKSQTSHKHWEDILMNYKLLYEPDVLDIYLMCDTNGDRFVSQTMFQNCLERLKGIKEQHEPTGEAQSQKPGEDKEEQVQWFEKDEPVSYFEFRRVIEDLNLNEHCAELSD